MGREWGVANRREFITALLAAAVARKTRPLAAGAILPMQARQSLVPSEPSSAPNYWCTWSAQNYMYGQHLQTLDPGVLEGSSGSKLAHDAMSEKVLFGDGGWVTDFFPKVRKDLFFLLDDGWEVGGTSTFELDSAKFPSFKGSGAERLSRLNQAIEGAGWRGA